MLKISLKFQRSACFTIILPTLVLIILLENMILIYRTNRENDYNTIEIMEQTERNNNNMRIVDTPGSDRSIYNRSTYNISTYNKSTHNDSKSSPEKVPWTFISLPETPEEKLYYRMHKEIINPFEHEFLIDGRNICDENTTIVVLVHSTLEKFDRRDAIRHTWGGVATGATQWPGGRAINANIKIAFVFGQRPNWTESLMSENEMTNDIIQGDFIDSYQNLTLKSLLGLKWVVDFCSNISFVIKSDDDMFINLPYLVDMLQSKGNIQRTIIGPLNLGSSVRRAGKWKVDKKIYPFPKYPPYESGSAYVFTADIIGELFEAAKYVTQISIDDVYITGILARTLGINHARTQGFAFWKPDKLVICNILLDKVVTSHKVSGQKLRNLWRDLNNAKKERCL